MTREKLKNTALEIGFKGVWVISPDAFWQWGAYVRDHSHPRFKNLTHNPEAILPGARSLILLAWPYTPYACEPRKAALSAYYPASNACYHATRRLLEWILENGAQAEMGDALPVKMAALRAGAGALGVNGLVALENMGTRAALGLIVTDARLEPDAAHAGFRLDARCKGCVRCAAACPVGAIRGDGSIALDRCLRALPEGEPLPLYARPLIGASLMGCDICQDACPRNAHIARAAMPGQVARATALERLLEGDVRPLAALIGPNFVRKKRVQSRALILAANLDRTDLLPSILALCQDSSPLVRDAAAWALEKLDTHCKI